MKPPTCPSGKMAYPQPIEKLVRTYNQGKRQRVRWYYCPECGWWHIGRGRVRIIKKEKVKSELEKHQRANA